MWNSVADTKMNKTRLSSSRNLLTTFDWNGCSSLMLYSPKPPTVPSSIPTKHKETWRFNPHWFSCLFCFYFADFKIWSLLKYFFKASCCVCDIFCYGHFVIMYVLLRRISFYHQFIKQCLGYFTGMESFSTRGSQLFASCHLGFHSLYQL